MAEFSAIFESREPHYARAAAVLTAGPSWSSRATLIEAVAPVLKQECVRSGSAAS